MAVLALCAILWTAGCGGDSSDATTNSGSSTTVFVRKANAICRQGTTKFNARSAPILKKIGNQSEAATQRELIRVAVKPTFEREIREIRALEPPSTDQEDVDAILSAMHKVVVQLSKDPTSRGSYPYRNAEDLAAGYGLVDCGHP